MTCKHEHGYAVATCETFAYDFVSQLGQRRCLKCSAVVPYGASWDAGEHAASVAIEQRAAELALNLPGVYNGQLHIKACADCELCGIGAHAGLEGHWEPRNARDPWHAGYLARCIATHQDPK